MKLQIQDTKIINLLNRLKVGDLDVNVYLVDDGILRCRIMESTGNEFKPIVIPKCLMDHVLVTAHDYSGHNGFPRMYAAVRCLYFWVGMKRDISHHCKKCQICAKHNIAKVKFKKTHFKGVRQPMQFYLYGSGRWVPPLFLTRTQVCFNSYLYAHQLHILHPTEDKDSWRSPTGIHQKCLQ